MRREPLGVGVVGTGFMGTVHAQAWRTVAHRFDLPLRPLLVAVAGRDAERTRRTAEREGFAHADTDWRVLVARTDVDLVDACAPDATHAEIAVTALRAGKHVLCEKPLAHDVAAAEEMVAAAEAAAHRGVRSMLGHSYRRVPALALARELVRDGRLGELRHASVSYLQDWLADPAAPATWRLDARQAAGGALGDLGSHAVDLLQHVTGRPVVAVSGSVTTFVHERPGPDGAPVPVTVDDAATFLARLDGGPVATVEVSRAATGSKNALRVRLAGTGGALAFDLERMNELEVLDAADGPRVAGPRRVLVTQPEHPWLRAWWPPGHGLGYEHTFTHQAADLVAHVATGTDPSPSFADGLQVQRVLDAVRRSADDDARWTPVG